MPEICRFFGIVITIYADDHNPPHFHARYGDYRSMIDIVTGDIFEGEMPKKSLRLLQAWCEIHRDELMRNWQEGQKENPNFFKIEPLK
jgi:hypothetical protein